MGHIMQTGNRSGFTLIEIMIVMTILGILATLIVPRIDIAIVHARESVLKQDLFTLRDKIDQYFSDHGSYPPHLDSLREAGYVRGVPKDPFTESSETWVEIYVDSGVFDVHSGSDLVGIDDVPYNQW